MAQLKDLLVTGVARFLNGVFITGESITSDITPFANDSYSLGTSTKNWKDINASGAHIGTSGIIMNGDITVSGTHNIGSSSAKWNNIYATTFTGNLSGNATTATRANISTTQNAIAKYSNTTGTFANSGITIDGSNNITTPGNIYLTGTPTICWSDGTYRQRIAVTDDSVADTAVFSFQQSVNSGTSYGDLLIIRDNGDLYPTGSIRNLPIGGGIFWNPYVESTTDASDAVSMRVQKAGSQGGTELQIQIANDNNDTINLKVPKYIVFNDKIAFDVADSWLRINESKQFTSGVYFGNNIVRTDGQLQVGSDGNTFYANSSGNGYFSNTLGIAGTNTDFKLYVNGPSNFTGELLFADNIGIKGYMAGGSDWWGITGSGSNDSGRLKIFVADNGISDWMDFEFRDYGGNIYTPLKMTGNQVLFGSKVQPAVNNTYALGASDYKWSNIYSTASTADNFYGSLGKNQATIQVDGDANTYYPVIISRPCDYYPGIFLSISRAYNEAAPDTWNTATHRGGLTLTLYWNNSNYWDGNTAGGDCSVFDIQQTYSTMVAKLGNSTAGKVVWLRGGGAVYHIFSPAGTQLATSIKYSTYTDAASQSFAPTTTTETITRSVPLNVSYATTAGGVAWANVTGKPSTFTPSTHSHSDYVTLTTAQTISGAKTFSSTALQLSSHLYRGIYDASGNVFDHYYNGTPTTNTYANLRVYNSTNSSFRLLRFGGDGTFTWDGNNVLTAGNYTSYTVTKTGSGASGTWGINATGYATKLLGVNSSGTPYSNDAGNLIQAVWNVQSDSRWYLKATGYECRVGYADAAATANAIKTISFTGGNENVTGYRLIYTFSISTWTNSRMSFLVTSRHTGDGLVTIAVGNNSGTLQKDNVYGQIKYFGNTNCGSIIAADSYQLYVSADGTKAYLFWKYSDYTTATITPLSSLQPSNGTWTTSIPEATYGTLLAQTTISDNATTATKLATARTIWGQSFDGSANVSGNMTGVGNINTAAAPAGTIYTNNWFRSKGATGWYSEDYGGGWYMNDDTWIRNYGNKSLYMNTAKVRTDMVEGGSWIHGTHVGAFEVKTATAASANAFFQSWFSGKTPSGAWGIGPLAGSNDLYFAYGTDANYNAGTNTVSTVRFGSDGKVYGAVWNDYAEYRESTTIEAGRVVYELGDDTTAVTTKRLSHFAGIISDTYGYAEGETEKAKTPLAVAGRVLAYPYQDRNNYMPGDCVCAAPNGTVDIMTRKEVELFPDRIVGTVSCVPTYDTWGTDNISVNGRIWIKVR